jgi:hypothetical protein
VLLHHVTLGQGSNPGSATGVFLFATASTAALGLTHFILLWFMV